MKLDPLTDLISRETAAVELNLSLGALRTLHRNGRIQFLKINQKCVRVVRSDLERLKRELAADGYPARRCASRTEAAAIA
jgi:hypothetical protein